VAGQFAGSLANEGEALRLEDAIGDGILDFRYRELWYPITDGVGFSLVMVEENGPWDTWGQQERWRPGNQVNGTPGATDPQPPWVPSIVINEVLSHAAERLEDAVELFNPTDVDADISGWFLTDDLATPSDFVFPTER